MEIGPLLLEHLWQLLLMLVLLCFSAFFSGSETAFFSLCRHDLKHYGKSGSRTERIILDLLSQPRSLLIAVLFGNMVVNILFFSISALLAEKLGESLGNWALAGVGLSSLMAVIVFGEVVPKSVAVKIPQRFSRMSAFPLFLFQKMVRLVTRLIEEFADWLGDLASRKLEKKKYVTQEELKTLLDLSRERGIIDPREGHFIKEVLELGDIRVKEVMTPRVDIGAFDLSGTRSAFLEFAQARKLSRVPVFRGDLDTIEGILRTKEVIFSKDEDLAGLVRKVPFIPENKTVESLLREFVEKKIAIAVVVDEYGGTEGLVALEDVLEEIVGEIWDEFDEAESPIREVGEGRYLLAGNFSLRDWSDMFNVEMSLPSLATMGGFVTSLLGHLPATGETAEFRGWRFTVKGVKRNRILHLLMEREGLETGTSTGDTGE
jgi:CBS domain containing-hemolysin-like protein